MEFNISELPAEYYHQTACERMLKNNIHRVAGTAVSWVACPADFKPIRARSDLGKWLKDRAHVFGLRRIPGDGYRHSQYVITVDLTDPQDIMYFKLRWGGK